MLYDTKNPHGGDVYGERIDYDFSSNTNPFGTPAGVRDAICRELEQVHHYPDPYCRALVRAISQAEQVPESYILCGNGAAELIYSYCQAVHPQKAMETAPTFSEYSLGLERVGCQVLRYVLEKDRGFELDEGILEALRRGRPQVLFLCNPNNPTGMTIPQDLLREIADLCRDLEIRLFLDECFLDLADRGESLKPLLEENRQIFLLKAFTKNYGMAGIRLGYCLTADRQLLQAMSRTVQPWNVSSLAQAAGIGALQERGFLDRTRAYLPAERRWLRQQLESLGLQVCPSHANYLLFQGPSDLDQRLLAHHIALRSCANYHGLGTGWFRTAVRLREENEQLILALGQALGKE